MDPDKNTTQQGLEAMLIHMQPHSWGINKGEIQGPSTQVKFLDVRSMFSHFRNDC